MTFHYKGLLSSPTVPPATEQYVWLRTSGMGEAYTKYNTLRKAMTSRDLPTTYVTTTTCSYEFRILNQFCVALVWVPQLPLEIMGWCHFSDFNIHICIFLKPKLLQSQTNSLRRRVPGIPAFYPESPEFKFMPEDQLPFAVFHDFLRPLKVDADITGVQRARW
jgi:hypothetical protein